MYFSKPKMGMSIRCDVPGFLFFFFIVSGMFPVAICVYLYLLFWMVNGRNRVQGMVLWVE